MNESILKAMLLDRIDKLCNSQGWCWWYVSGQFFRATTEATGHVVTHYDMAGSPLMTLTAVESFYASLILKAAAK